MAELRPFAGIRFNPATVASLAAVVAPPYDVITPRAQRDYLARDEHNIVRLELGDEPGVEQSHRNRFSEAAATYREWLRAGVLAADSRRGFYLYEESFDLDGKQYTRRSLFATVRLANWDERVVLPHEFTLPGPKIGRLNLLAATHAQFSPLLGMYDDPGALRPLLADVAETRPIAEFSLAPGSVAAAARQHRLWHIADPAALSEVVEAFRLLQIYIADGHHRYETALAYRDQQRQAGAGPESGSEFTLMALVETSDPGMRIFPTHRLLRNLGPVDPERTLRRLGEWFDVERLRLSENGDEFQPADGRGAFTMLGLEDGWFHRLTLRPSVDLARELADEPAELRDLDVVILRRLIFEPVFGLTRRDWEGGERVQFTRNPEEATRAFTTGQAQLIVFLNPTPMEKVRAAMKAGQRMPQKSTYFYPKPLTGLVSFDHALSF